MLISDNAKIYASWNGCFANMEKLSPEEFKSISCESLLHTPRVHTYVTTVLGYNTVILYA